MREEVLYKKAGSEVEAAESWLGMEVRRLGSRWPWARLCLVVGCTRESCWRMGEEWMVEEVRLKLVRGARGSDHHQTGDADTFGAKCKRAWRDGCRWGSEEEGGKGSG